MIKIPIVIIVLLCQFAFPAIAQSRRSVVIPCSLVPLYPRSCNTKGSIWKNITADSMAWYLRTTFKIDPGINGNSVFSYTDTPLSYILSDDIRRGRVRAFGTETDSFTSLLSYNQVFAITSHILANPAGIYRYRIIEGKLNMKYTGIQYRTILGIAPEEQDTSGVWTTLFWIYFPEITHDLADRFVDRKHLTTWKSIFDDYNFSASFLYATDTIRYPNCF